MKLKSTLFILGISALVSSLATHIYTPLLSQVRELMNASYFTTNLTVSIFTVALAAMQVVYGPLVDAKGRKIVLLPSILLYVAASIGCAYAGNIYLLLAMRILQGVGAAAIPLVAVTLIGDKFHGEERVKAMGIYQTLLAVTPAIGPPLGGLLGGSGHYGNAFLFLAFSGLAIFIMNAFWIKEEQRPPARPTIAANPSIAQNFLNVVRNKIGAIVLAIGFTTNFTLYTVAVLLPTFLNNRYSMGPALTGVVIMPFIVLLMGASAVSIRLQSRFGVLRSLLVTTASSIGAVVLFGCLAGINFPLLMASFLLLGFSLGLTLPMQTTLLSEQFVHNRATAIGVYNLVRYFGMAAGPTMGGILYTGGNDIILVSAVTALLLALSAVLARYLQPKETRTALSPMKTEG
ncbi:MFS transporter [Paenibacillus oleatilyticus]|uniref:MFS transporter n=1 Tax=Paenibacillus oleatilyticus TaxID=2594886 RepID=UPI001C1F2B9B|nr:MFS transporter [Paenibacillus oleatilyticus]MBU7316582.1 MFS transporter [Paenibacillus oleatilyticus]